MPSSTSSDLALKNSAADGKDGGNRKRAAPTQSSPQRPSSKRRSPSSRKPKLLKNWAGLKNPGKSETSNKKSQVSFAAAEYATQENANWIWNDVDEVALSMSQSSSFSDDDSSHKSYYTKGTSIRVENITGARSSKTSQPVAAQLPLPSRQQASIIQADNDYSAASRPTAKPLRLVGTFLPLLPPENDVKDICAKNNDAAAYQSTARILPLPPSTKDTPPGPGQPSFGSTDVVSKIPDKLPSNRKQNKHRQAPTVHADTVKTLRSDAVLQLGPIGPENDEKDSRNPQGQLDDAISQQQSYADKFSQKTGNRSIFTTKIEMEMKTDPGSVGLSESKNVQRNAETAIPNDKRVINIGGQNNIEVTVDGVLDNEENNTDYYCDDGAYKVAGLKSDLHREGSNLDLSKQTCDFKEHEPKDSFLRKTVCIVGALAAFIFVTSMCTFIFLQLQSKPTEIVGEQSEAFDPSAAPTTAIALDPFKLDQLPSDTVIQIINEHESPSSKAWEWIIADPSFSSMPHFRVIQRFALATLYYATDGAEWDYNLNWLDYSVHECEWLSFSDMYENLTTCHDDKDSYRSLVLPTNHMKGSLPVEISLLTSLEHVNFGGNEIQGLLSDQLMLGLSNLKSLNLFHNQLTGNISSVIGQLLDLNEIKVQNNQFHGPIPSQIGLLSNLKTMDFSKNLFTSVLPTEVGLLRNIENFACQWNTLTSSIPSEIGGCEKLVTFMVSNNEIKGILPSEFGNLYHLEELWAYNNVLTSSIPRELGNLQQLKVLNLIFNQLESTIPTELGNLRSLQKLHLSYNRLSSTIPSEIGGLSSLQYLYLDNNNVTGTIPHTIGKMTSLEKMNLSSLQLFGALPSAIGYLSSLAYIHIDHNALDEPLPTELGRLKKLEVLSGNYNQIPGVLPSEIAQLNRLIVVAFTSNMLEGNLATELGWLARLEELSLGNNMLTGPVPSTFGELWSLEALDIASNALTSSLPIEMFHFSSRLQGLYVELNLLDSSLPSEIGLLSTLEELVGWGNHLTGTLPSEIGLLSQIKKFDLYMNPSLKGTIPDEIGGQYQVEEIWLSSTSLTGTMPTSIGSLSMLQKLYLQKTRLTGKIPKQLTDLSNLTVLKIDETNLRGKVEDSFCAMERLSFTCSERLCGCECSCQKQ